MGTPYFIFFALSKVADLFNFRRCWFPANPNDESTAGEAWVSGTVTKRIIAKNGENVTLIFDLEKGDVRGIGIIRC